MRRSVTDGVTVLEVLQVVLIVLRLLNVIKWHWILVLSPLWIITLVVIGVIIFYWIKE